MKLEGKELSRYRVDELKLFLQSRGLGVSGKKADLIERLEEALIKESEEKDAKEDQDESPSGEDSVKEENKAEDEGDSTSAVEAGDAHTEEDEKEKVVEVTETEEKEDRKRKERDFETEEEMPKKKQRLGTPEEETATKEEVASTSEKVEEEGAKEETETKDQSEGLFYDDEFGSPSPCIKVVNFKRPFTLDMCRQYLSTHGDLVNFWIDKYRTHCYALYQDETAALKTLRMLHKREWPSRGGVLEGMFVDPQEMDQKSEGPTPKRQPHLPPQEMILVKPKREEKVSAGPQGMKLTKAEPPVYYLPRAQSKGAEKTSQ